MAKSKRKKTEKSLEKKIEYIFNQLCLSVDGDVSNKNLLKFEITPSSKDEIKIYKGFKSINVVNLSLNLTAAKYRDDQFTYVAFTLDDANHFLLPNNIEEIEVELPHFIYLAKEMCLEVSPIKSKDEIINDILWQQNEDDYRGHSYYEIIKYFKNIVIFRFNNGDIENNFNTERLFFYILSFSSRFNQINNYRLNELYSKVFSEVEKISHDNIFMSMTSPHRKHSFLEAYRCLEWIYVLPRILTLKDEIKYEYAGFNLANSCVKSLSWRRKEEDSITLLIKEAFKTSPSFEADSYWMQIFKNIPEEPEKIASRVYQIRNQYVHQFNPEREIDISDDECNELISFILKLLLILYKKYQHELL
ncbi:hypothetical protein ACIL2S_000372 [Vibrio fluvialis]|nr:hypothetical protein [Vibrio fluvialis]